MMPVADYRLLEVVAERDEGWSWLARPPERLGLEGAVWLHLLDQHASDDAYRRFVNELRVYAAARSDRLVPVLDAGHQSGRPFYATPAYELGSLSNADLAATAVLSMVADAADGLHALHEVGVAHRNVNPTAIYLTPTHAVLGDLSLATVIDPTLTITGRGPIGTMEYIAPEIVTADRHGRSGDIWALAATLHRVLTGSSIHPRLPVDSLASALRHIQTVGPELRDDLDPQVQALLVECFSHDPDGRPSTSAELASRLRDIAGGAR